MKERERRTRYAELMGDEALARQLDEAKHRRRCCGTWKHEPHEPACPTGRREARQRERERDDAQERKLA